MCKGLSAGLLQSRIHSEDYHVAALQRKHLTPPLAPGCPGITAAMLLLLSLQVCLQYRDFLLASRRGAKADHGLGGNNKKKNLCLCIVREPCTPAAEAARPSFDRMPASPFTRGDRLPPPPPSPCRWLEIGCQRPPARVAPSLEAAG